MKRLAHLAWVVVVGCSSASSESAATNSSPLACSSASDVAAAEKTYGKDQQTVQRVASACLVAGIGGAIGGEGGVGDGGPSSDGGRPALDGGAPVTLDDTFVEKMASCIVATTESQLSTGCATCYAKFESCVVATCSDCPGDPMGKECVACRCGKNVQGKSCVGDFEGCGGTKLAIDCAAALE